MDQGVGDLFKIDCDKEDFEALETNRLIWYSFGKGVELMKLDLFHLKKKISDAEDIARDIANLEKNIRCEYSYLHCLKLYIQICEKLIMTHVKTNNACL